MRYRRDALRASLRSHARPPIGGPPSKSGRRSPSESLRHCGRSLEIADRVAKREPRAGRGAENRPSFDRQCLRGTPRVNPQRTLTHQRVACKKRKTAKRSGSSPHEPKVGGVEWHLAWWSFSPRRGSMPPPLIIVTSIRLVDSDRRSEPSEREPPVTEPSGVWTTSQTTSRVASSTLQSALSTQNRSLGTFPEMIVRSPRWMSDECPMNAPPASSRSGRRR